MKNTLKQIDRYCQLLFALFLSALTFNVFLLPTKITAGGPNGIAIIVEKYTHLAPSVTILLISVVCLFAGFLLLSKENFLSTCISTFVYPLFVELTLPLAKSFTIDTSDLFLTSIIAGVLSGLALGLIYRNNFNSGSFGTISHILYKYFRISISQSNFVINAIVIIGGAFTFGWTVSMYAIIVLFIKSVIMDKVILGISSKKAFYIITKKSFEVERFIIDELNHSVTIFNAKGGFLIKNKKMLMAVVPYREYYMLTEGIKEIDPGAFFLATDAYQSYNGR